MMTDPMVTAQNIRPLDPLSACAMIRDLLRSSLQAQRAAYGGREPSYATIQAVVFHIRAIAGLTIQELASRLRVKPQAVSIVECGSSSFSASVLERLAQVAEQYCLPLAAQYIKALAVRVRHKSYRQGGRR